ncbi:XDD3 family exosortase-dependent surface protein [Alkalinema pantanalense CENA528]|uniref:XDD3 family exosortase-dependent surface protein n=1 Tax=Alkalinema pantanalense TaxID=1620705 RepID=UPI003D6E86ED
MLSAHKIATLAQVTGLTAATLCVALVATPSQANAYSLNGWDYAIGGSNNGSGGSVFDYKGIAIKESGDSIFVALNTNMTLQGSLYNNKEVINYGDLFFNFTGKSFKAASDAGQLVGIHFATNGSQSGVSQVGVYSNVKAKSTTAQNYGYANLTKWSDWTKTTNKGAYNDSFGDLTARDSYFAGQQSGSGTILNAIQSGQKVSDIFMMSSADLQAAGLNFAQFGGNGSQTLGFSFKRTADFKVGSFVANLFAECGNDGLAIRSNLHKVPEPTTMAGIAAVAGLGLLGRRRRRAA